MLPSSQTVSLGATPVGRLQVDRDGRTEFRLLASYRAAYPQPVLGQVFLDDPDSVFVGRSRLTPWFSNLLPEGALRELIAKQAHTHDKNEYALLRQLRDDLPGNVTLNDEDGVSEIELEEGSGEEAKPEDESPWKFSLAGVQLKFSAIRSDRGLTIPARGAGGDWIVKLPDVRFDGVPANEYATMSWAKASGIEVPAFELVELSKIEGLQDVLLGFRERHAFAIRRFDRSQAGQRIHIEDFAQVIGVYPQKKYERLNYEGLARLVLAIDSRKGLEEFIRRLTFIVASGNGDAHLKNWSLIYRDGRKAELSPAYDLVSTIQYMPKDSLALNLANTKQWERVTMAAFERLASKLHLDSAYVRGVVDASVHSIRQAWQSDAVHYGFTQGQRERIDTHLSTVPLFST